MLLPTTFNQVLRKDSVENLFATLNQIPFHLRSKLPLDSLFDRLERQEKMVRFSMTKSHRRTLVFLENSLVGTAYENESYSIKELPENSECFYLSLTDFDGKSFGTCTRMLQLAATYFPYEFTMFYVEFQKACPLNYADGKEIIYENGYHVFRNYLSFGTNHEFILLTELPLIGVNYAGAYLRNTTDVFVEVTERLLEFL